MLANQSCEKDDICPEGTPTTPQLVIRFYDAALPDETKTVSSLNIYGLNDLDVPVFFTEAVETTDSIAIPLRTDVDITRLVFHKDLVATSDLAVGNPDELTISYSREDKYVSRACGFKAIFNILNTNLETDADNWIISTTIENSTVEDENTAHIKVFH